MFSASTKSGKNSGSTPDPQFNYVTMLLHGDGTNGAQNNTFLDSSTNNFTITRNGNTTQGSFSPYGSNWSNYFDGSSYLTTSSTQIIPTGSFTVECYVFVTGSGNNQKFVSQGSSGAAGRFSIGIEGGNWWVQLGGDAIQTGTPVRNQWNYVAATFNGSTLSLYVNGSLISSVSSSANAQNTTLTIGQDWNSYITTGYISNVRVSNTVRTVTTTPTAPFTSDGNTKLLACQANRFLDSSANAFALTVNGNPSVQRFNPFGTSTAYSTSVIGGSGYFDGTGDYLSANCGRITSDFTVEGWAFFSSAAANKALCTVSALSSPSYGLVIYTDGTNWRLYVGATSWVISNQSIGSFSPNSWSHIAVTRSGSTVRGFVNGVLGFTGTFSGSIGESSSATYTFIGEYSNWVPTGYISNFRMIFGSAVYTSSFTPPTAPLTAITNTKLLLDMTNGAIYDNAMMNDLETVGNAQISTSVKKYGTGSMYFDGTGDYLTIANSPNLQFSTGAFTFECWIYLNSTAGTKFIADFGNNSLNGWSLYDDGSLQVRIADVDRIATTGLSTSTWYHLAVVRSGTTMTLYVDGVSKGSYASASTDFSYSGSKYVGNTVNGYIDDLRITKGYARYTTTFTPPTAAFPNTGPI